MRSSPIPPAAVGAPSPTSRSVFRLLARSVGATNREADGVRRDLLATWEDPGTDDDGAGAGLDQLVARLQAIDAADPAGDLGAEIRLAAWCSAETTRQTSDHEAGTTTEAVSASAPAEALRRVAAIDALSVAEVVRLLEGGATAPDPAARTFHEALVGH